MKNQQDWRGSSVLRCHTKLFILNYLIWCLKDFNLLSDSEIFHHVQNILILIFLPFQNTQFQFSEEWMDLRLINYLEHIKFVFAILKNQNNFSIQTLQFFPTYFSKPDILILKTENINSLCHIFGEIMVNHKHLKHGKPTKGNFSKIIFKMVCNQVKWKWIRAEFWKFSTIAKYVQSNPHCVLSISDTYLLK